MDQAGVEENRGRHLPYSTYNHPETMSKSKPGSQYAHKPTVQSFKSRDSIRNCNRPLPPDTLVDGGTTTQFSQPKGKHAIKRSAEPEKVSHFGAKRRKVENSSRSPGHKESPINVDVDSNNSKSGLNGSVSSITKPAWKNRNPSRTPPKTKPPDYTGKVPREQRERHSQNLKDKENATTEMLNHGVSFHSSFLGTRDPGSEMPNNLLSSVPPKQTKDVSQQIVEVLMPPVVGGIDRKRVTSQSDEESGDASQPQTANSARKRSRTNERLILPFRAGHETRATEVQSTSGQAPQPDSGALSGDDDTDELQEDLPQATGKPTARNMQIAEGDSKLLEELQPSASTSGMLKKNNKSTLRVQKADKPMQIKELTTAKFELARDCLLSYDETSKAFKVFDLDNPATQLTQFTVDDLNKVDWYESSKIVILVGSNNLKYNYVHSVAITFASQEDRSCFLDIIKTKFTSFLKKIFSRSQ